MKMRMDMGVADTAKDHKRKHDDDKDDDDEDPPSGTKPGKPVEEPTIAMRLEWRSGEDVVRDDDQPQDASEPKTAKTPNPEWFTQPPRPPTPDPEWNKVVSFY
ncbi:hypothetical protein Tco_0992702 [Tanacetum coccineum]|uniref:Uncharacterized protein n=1 Tax=Tanacetum coccineum TaxID=301880 RepID=A0ABQ5F3J5_9ASTR